MSMPTMALAPTLANSLIVYVYAYDGIGSH